MLIPLPRDAAERRRALDWLNAEGVPHLALFQAVQISDREQALRFRQFLETCERMGA
ncbi:hypothetical protein [Brevundimonas goettingensis]|uniref:Uncharacterized protein n=1 Tax=Brevundimonas goettingensis TaxID=2774190 RepID=A0A975C3A0_9CAUL|nr:hypothetical protein [Brevundimonas goettingensis]QTC93063.1 hypothetical protein IFJ75_09580 [Brevundimonas goettingensis]